MHHPFSRDCQTRLPSHSWLQRVCVQMCLLPAPTRPRADASALTRLCRRVRADASTRRRVCTDASAPTHLLRHVRADASTPTRPLRRVCADASGPTRLHRRVCADASPLACQNMDFRSKTLIPLNTSLKNSKKTSSEITTFAKNDNPYRSFEFSAVDLRPLQKWKIAPKSSIPLEAS